jgi:hypothetical protein
MAKPPKTDDTDAAPSENKGHLWKPGQSGNPAGRPVGSRTRLGEKFLADLMVSWEKHGEKALEKVRRKDPTAYVRVVAATLPKELSVKVSDIDDLSDDEIARRLVAIHQELARAGVDFGAGAAEAPPANQIN